MLSKWFITTEYRTYRYQKKANFTYLVVVKLTVYSTIDMYRAKLQCSSGPSFPNLVKIKHPKHREYAVGWSDLEIGQVAADLEYFLELQY